MTTTVDEGKLEDLMGQLVGHMTGSALCFGIWLGDELGLYRTLVELGPSSADDRLDVLRPAPPRSERVAADLAAGELHHLDGDRRVGRAGLVRGREVVDVESCHAPVARLAASRRDVPGQVSQTSGSAGS